jgi:hypothetical protein
MTTSCKHKNTKELTRPFAGPVSKKQNPRAHGGVCYVDRCLDCGAERRTNVNGNHAEQGKWVKAEEES